MAPALIDECLLFGYLAVSRPVEQPGRAVFKKLWVEVLVLALGEKRLVRVKGFDLQKPVVFRVVAADELDAGLEGLGLGLVLLAAHVLPVDAVLTMPHAAARIARMPFYRRWVGHLPNPRIALLAAEELPSAVLGVVGGTAGLPIVVVVADEVRRDSRVAQHPRRGVVERLQRPPRAVEEIGPPGVQIAASRHARHGADVAGIECQRPLGEPLEIGRVRPIAAVGRQHVPVERVEHDHNYLHALTSCRSWRACCPRSDSGSRRAMRRNWYKARSSPSRAKDRASANP